MRILWRCLLAIGLIGTLSGITILDRYKGFIVGPDERVIIDLPECPWTAIGKIEVYAGPNQREFDHYCTGALVGERLVLTSANCLYLPGSGELGGSFVFKTEYRNCEPYVVSDIIHVHVPEYYRYSAYPRNLISAKYDWAVGVLADPIGMDAGFFNVLDITHLNFKWPRAGFNTAGFEQKSAPQLQAHLDCVIQETDADQTIFYHACNTVPGFSGAPIWFMFNGTPTIVGVTNMVAFHDETKDNVTNTAADYDVAASRDFVYKVLEYRTYYYDDCYTEPIEERAAEEKEKEKQRDAHPCCP